MIHKMRCDMMIRGGISSLIPFWAFVWACKYEHIDEQLSSNESFVITFGEWIRWSFKEFQEDFRKVFIFLEKSLEKKLKMFGF